jgi:hypothetical protein
LPVAGSSISGETPRVQPSEEIRRLVIRLFDALRDGDQEAVSNRISRQPGFERFGTDAVEFQPAREVDLKGVEGLQKVYPLAAAVG